MQLKCSSDVNLWQIDIVYNTLQPTQAQTHCMKSARIENRLYKEILCGMRSHLIFNVNRTQNVRRRLNTLKKKRTFKSVRGYNQTNTKKCI